VRLYSLRTDAPQVLNPAGIPLNSCCQRWRTAALKKVERLGRERIREGREAKAQAIALCHGPQKPWMEEKEEGEGWETGLMKGRVREREKERGMRF
jgi:hypothetical protein